MDGIPCYDGRRSAEPTAVARELSRAKVGSRNVVERSDEMMYHKTTAKAGWCCILKPLSKEQCRVSHAHSCLSFCLHLLTQFFLFSLLYPALPTPSSTPQTPLPNASSASQTYSDNSPHSANTSYPRWASLPAYTSRSLVQAETHPRPQRNSN
jgi:hypothetical protein